MGASGKWIKTLVGLKPAAAEKEKHGGSGKGRKWSRLWRSSSGGQQRGAASAAASEVSETSSSAADALSSVVAAVVRAPPKDFRVIRDEWAAVRIQTAFRGFLVRRRRRSCPSLNSPRQNFNFFRVSLRRPEGR